MRSRRRGRPVRVFTGVREGAGRPARRRHQAGRPPDRPRDASVRLRMGCRRRPSSRPPHREDVTHGEVCFGNRGQATIRLAGDRTPVRFSGVQPVRDPAGRRAPGRLPARRQRVLVEHRRRRRRPVRAGQDLLLRVLDDVGRLRPHRRDLGGRAGAPSSEGARSHDDASSDRAEAGRPNRRPLRGRRAAAPALCDEFPSAAWICAAIAAANAVCWAATTPPYWVPDEIAGIGYVQYVAENGDVPRTSVGRLLRRDVLRALHRRGPSDLAAGAERRDLRERSTRDLVRSRAGQAGYLVNYPPLYYALGAIPYRIAYDASFLDRIFAMRLLGALFAALTVFFVFMFVRELHAADAVGVDRRRAGGRVPADVRLHERWRQQRHPAVRGCGSAVLPDRTGVPARPHDFAGRGDRA